MGDFPCGKCALRRFTADDGVELADFLMPPGGLALGAKGVFEAAPVLRASFRTVPGGFKSRVSVGVLGRLCFFPERSP